MTISSSTRFSIEPIMAETYGITKINEIFTCTVCAYAQVLMPGETPDTLRNSPSKTIPNLLAGKTVGPFTCGPNVMSANGKVGPAEFASQWHSDKPLSEAGIQDIEGEICQLRQGLCGICTHIAGERLCRLRTAASFNSADSTLTLVHTPISIVEI